MFRSEKFGFVVIWAGTCLGWKATGPKGVWAERCVGWEVFGLEGVRVGLGWKVYASWYSGSTCRGW